MQGMGVVEQAIWKFQFYATELLLKLAAILLSTYSGTAFTPPPTSIAS